ncbi:MAG TPA: helix-turn-helix transcriptional regulator [Puia sp.]|nr:helix-turn-helix transcriptional regulator [Puia sp.]
MQQIRPRNAWQPHLAGSFSIECLEEAGCQPAGSTHRHEHFELIFVTAGRLNCTVDLGEYSLYPGDICFIQPAKMHHFSGQQMVKGFLLCFAPQFCRLSVENTMALNTHPPYLRAPHSKQTAMTDLLRYMKKEFDHAGLFHMEVLNEFLKIFLIYLGRLSAEQTRLQCNRGTQIFEQFTTLLERKYLTHRRPADYAGELFLSTSYLNQTVKSVSGRTTSYHIHQRVVLEAQRMAVYSNSSLKEAASNLGFDDICHFSRFFKKAAGQSFKDFKQHAPVVEL